MAAATKQESVPSLSESMDAAFTEGMAGIEADAAAGVAVDTSAVEALATRAELAEARKEVEPAKEVAKEPAKVDDPAKGATPADAKATDPKAVPDVPAIDPYEGTVPLTLTVNGQPVPVDGILLADGGGLIPPDKLAGIQDRLTRGIQAEATVQRLTEDGRQSAHVLSQLKHTVGEDEYTGLAAFEAMKADRAALASGTNAILGFLNDPQFVYDLALANQNNDTATAAALLKRAMDGASASFENTQLRTIRAADRLQQSGPPPAPIAPEEGLTRAVDTLMAHESLKGLNAEDRAAALRYFGPFAGNIVRAATAEEAQRLGLKPGDAVAEYAKMTAWFEDRLAWRKGEAERATNTEKQLKQTEDAAAFNARISKNRQPVKTEPTKAAKALPDRGDDGRFKDTPKTKRSKAEEWDEIFESGMREANLG